MADDTPQAPARADLPANQKLDSWKEIAAYLKRDVTTVRRWEKRENLPVRRHPHAQRDSVYAFTSEIDEWWTGRRSHLAANGVTNGGPPTSGTSRVSARIRAALPWGLAATFLVTTLGLTAHLARRSTTPHVDRAILSILPPTNTSFASLSLSPDGRQLAFTATPTRPHEKTLLWVRPLDGLEARTLPDTEDATFPFWSPDGEAVGFFAGGKLWTVQVSGGNPRVVCDAPNGRGGTWNREGTIVFAPDRDAAIFRVPASGGEARPVTALSGPEVQGHLWPEFLPDGRHFLYLSNGYTNSLADHSLVVGSLDDTTGQRLTPLASNAVYSDGHLLFVHERRLLAQPFDATRLALTGASIAIADQVRQRVDHKADFALSSSGILVYHRLQSPATRLVWHDRARPGAVLTGTPAEYTEPALSPDESRVAISLFDPQPSSRFGFGVVGVRSDIWLLDTRSGAASQFTSDPSADWGATWSPDGRSLVFSSDRSGQLALYRKEVSDADGAGSELPSTGINPVAQSWSPDGTFLLYSSFDANTRSDLWLLPLSGDRTPRPLLRSPASENHARLSPNGQWVAYTSDESGRAEVYVRRFPITPETWRISAAGGSDARWRPDGGELFYVADDRRLMSVTVKTGAGLAHGPAIPLFDTGVWPHWYEARNLYDVSRDGRFLFMTPIEEDRSAPLTVVLSLATTLTARPFP